MASRGRMQLSEEDILELTYMDIGDAGTFDEGNVEPWCDGDLDVCYPSGSEDETSKETPDAMSTSGAGDSTTSPGATIYQSASQRASKILGQETMTWIEGKDNSHACNIPKFIGEQHVNLALSGTEPLDIFGHLFPDSLMEGIVFQTNLYALQQDISNPLNFTKGELMVFLGINIVMTYICYPRVRMYWSSQPGLRCNFFADKMSVNRFEKIRRYLHFTDNNAVRDDGNDKLWKIRPVLERLRETFRNAMDPEECHSVDEMMIPFTGRRSL